MNVWQARSLFCSTNSSKRYWWHGGCHRVKLSYSWLWERIRRKRLAAKEPVTYRWVRNVGSRQDQSLIHQRFVYWGSSSFILVLTLPAALDRINFTVFRYSNLSCCKWLMSLFVCFSPLFLLADCLNRMTEAEQSMVSAIRNCSELESPSPEAAKSLLMIVTTKPDEGFTEFSKMVRLHNQQPPFGFPEPDIFKTFVRVRTKWSLSTAVDRLATS